MTRRRRQGVKNGKTIQPVISSLSVLHSSEHPERCTEISREEKAQEGDRGDLVEKGERATKPVITPRVKTLTKESGLKGSKSVSRSGLSDSLQPHGLYSPWNSLGRILEWVALPFSRGSSQPRE